MFIIVCVVYNKRIDAIGSIGEFLAFRQKHDDVELRVYDNSAPEISAQNSQACKSDFKDAVYCSNGGNIGLSKSYNKALASSHGEDWLFWADDDTVFSCEYLESVYSAAKADKYPVICGIVKTQTGTILSPTSVNKSDTEAYAPNAVVDEVNCINSGLCVKRSVYEAIGSYDEGLFIDMIDYWLFDELRKKQLGKVFIAAGAIDQNFSGNETIQLGKALHRFRIYKKDFLYYCKTEHKSYRYRVYILAKRLLRIAFMTLKKVCKH